MPPTLNPFGQMIDGTANPIIGQSITDMSEFVITALEAPVVLQQATENIVCTQGSNGTEWEILKTLPTAQYRVGRNAVSGWSPEMDHVEIFAELPLVVKFELQHNEIMQWKVNKLQTFKDAVIEVMLRERSSVIANAILNAGQSYVCKGYNSDGSMAVDDLFEMQTRYNERYIGGNRVAIHSSRAALQLRQDMKRANLFIQPMSNEDLLRRSEIGMIAGWQNFEDPSILVTTGGSPYYTQTSSNIFMERGAIKVVTKDMRVGVPIPGTDIYEYMNPNTGVSFKISTSSIGDPLTIVYMFEITFGVGIPDTRKVDMVTSVYTPQP